jgi:hypothetical protein
VARAGMVATGAPCAAATPIVDRPAAMFGHRAKRQPDHEQDFEVDVDLNLERDISTVEQAVESYLQNPNESLREDLLAALEELDAQTAQSDDYHGRLVFPFAAPESSVVGATSPSSVGKQMPSDEFQAQVALVRAAKNAVTRLTPDTLADLRAASETLGAWANVIASLACPDHNGSR